MNTLRYEISEGESLTRWHITEVKKQSFSSPCEAFYHPVNLREDYIQVIYPVRKEFLKKNDLSKIDRYDGKFDTIYFPMENSRVDFSTFFSNPTVLSFNARSHILAPKDSSYPFSIYTCGAVKIWIDGILALTFAPFTRDVASKTTLTLNLSKGLHQIDVFAQELAERDVFFYFELRYTGKTKGLYGVLETESDPEEIRRAEALLRSIGFQRDEFSEGPVKMFYDPKQVYSQNLKLNVSSDINGIFPTLGGSKDFILSPKDDSTVIADVASCNPGSWSVFVALEVQGSMIKRKLNTAIRKADSIMPAATEDERKIQALKFISQLGENVVNMVLVRIALNLEKPGSLSQRSLECLDVSLKMIENKSDCADFYLAPLLVLVKNHSEYLDSDTRRRIDSAILNFRYWMDEKGNDSMWWFSENHAFLFHLCQYAAGKLYADKIFTVSGKTGSQQAEIGRQRVMDWFKSFREYGICEWNSATYIPVDLIGLFSLRLLTDDGEIRREVDNALDFIFRLIAVNSFKSVMSSSFGRAYEDTLKYRFQVEPCFINYVAYAEGHLTRGTRAVSLYCISDYHAPDFTLPETSGGYEIKLSQAKDPVDTYNFKTEDYSLSCVQNFRPFTHGHQQHLMNAALGDLPIQFFINHPGERVLSGENRPSYWAGNGTMPLIYQKNNCMLMLFDIEDDELVKGIHAYAPTYQFDVYEKRGPWAFFRSSNAYLGVFFSEDFYLTSNGPNKDRELFSPGQRHAVVVRLSSRFEYQNLNDFEEAMLKSPLSFDTIKHTFTFTDPLNGVLDINGFRGHYPREMEINRVSIPVDKTLIKSKMELTLKAFETILYKSDSTFLENMKKKCLAKDEINRYRFWEWPQGVGLFGICKLHESTKEKHYLDILTTYYEQRISEGLPAKNINTMAPILALCYVAKVTGNEKFKAVCLEWALWAMNGLPRTEEGGFQHITSDTVNHNELWDDTLLMAVCSLAYTGELLDRQDFIDEATKQTLIHIRHLKDENSKLWFHGYTFDLKNNFSKALWARGNSWVTISLPMLLKIKTFASDPKERKIIEDTLIQQINTLCECQDPSGMWHTLLLDKTSYLESSATCGIGYGILTAYCNKYVGEKALESAKAAIEPIIRRISEEGIVKDVSYGTPMGRTDQDFYKKIPKESTPYGQALALLFLAKILMIENKLKEVTL